MKIGYVLKQFPKLSETFVLNEILELERQGAEVTIFALGPGRDQRIHRGVTELNAPIHYLASASSGRFVEILRSGQERIEERIVPLFTAGRNVIEAPGVRPLPLIRAAIELVIGAPDLDRLHAHFAGPAAHVARVASAGLGIPYGFTCHAKDIYHESVSHATLRSLHDSADAVVTVCEANRQFLESEVLTGPSDRLQILYNGVDTNSFNPANRRPDPRPSVLAVGRLVPKKGFRDLIDAVGILARRGMDLRCEILGDGVLRPVLESRIRECGLERHVRLLGAVDQSEVRRKLQSAWVLALPCIVAEDGNRDALPTVLLEALASGTPVVSTPVTGVSEIVTDGREGLLVPERDPAELASALSVVLEDQAVRAGLGRRGRETAETRFDLRKNVARLLEIFSLGRPDGGAVHPVPDGVLQEVTV